MDKTEQKKLIIKLADLVKDAGKLLSESLLDPSRAEENAKMISALEQEGDGIQDILDEDFKNQRNIPYLALDRARLVRRLDDILDQIVLTARTHVAFNSGLDNDFSSKIKPLADLCANITECLEEAVTVIYTSFQQAHDITLKIEKARDLAVTTAFELETQFYKEVDPTTGWRKFEAVSRIITNTIKCIVKTKAASEVIEIMAFKYD